MGDLIQHHMNYFPDLEQAAEDSVARRSAEGRRFVSPPDSPPEGSARGQSQSRARQRRPDDLASLRSRKEGADPFGTPAHPIAQNAARVSNRTTHPERFARSSERKPAPHHRRFALSRPRRTRQLLRRGSAHALRVLLAGGSASNATTSTSSAVGSESASNKRPIELRRCEGLGPKASRFI